MTRMPDISGLVALIALLGLVAFALVVLVWLEDKVPGLPKVLLYLGLFLWGVSLMPF